MIQAIVKSCEKDGREILFSYRSIERQNSIDLGGREDINLSLIYRFLLITVEWHGC